MKSVNNNRRQRRNIRHKRITNKFNQFANALPRLVVTKTNANIIAQLIDDASGKVIASSSSMQLKLSNGNVANAKLVGSDIAKKAIAAKIEKVVFDRGGNKYHGRVAALADAARESGLKF